MSDIRYGEEIRTVESWINQGGDHPSDAEIAEALSQLATQWCQWKQDGMDVVALSIVERIESICKALRDE